MLDLGCGTGALLERLRSSGFRAVALDGHRAFATHVVARPVVRGDARRIPFRDGVFDAVTLVHVLAHIDDVGAALAEIFRFQNV